MRARWLIAPLLAFGSACSLVYGLHDNVGPIAFSDGCSIDSGQHTFCELFDELPVWPAEASMPIVEGNPTLSGDAGCDTPPRCLVALGNGSAARDYATPGGVHQTTIVLHVRFDSITQGVPVARVAWVDVHSGAAIATTWGITMYELTTQPQDYIFWVNDVDADNSPRDAVSLHQWYTLSLSVDFDKQSATLQNVSTLATSVLPFPTKVLAADVTSLTFHAGVGTADTTRGATVDTVLVDIN